MFPVIFLLIFVPAMVAGIIAFLPPQRRLSAGTSAERSATAAHVTAVPARMPTLAEWHAARSHYQLHAMLGGVALVAGLVVAIVAVVGMAQGAFPSLQARIEAGEFGDAATGTFIFAPEREVVAELVIKRASGPAALSDDETAQLEAQLRRQAAIRAGLLGQASRVMTGAPPTRDTVPMAAQLHAVEFVELWPAMRLTYFVGLDGMTAPMVLVVYFLGLCGYAAWWAGPGERPNSHPRLFLLAYLLLHASVSAAFCALDGMMLMIALAFTALLFAVMIGGFGWPGAYRFAAQVAKGRLFGATATMIAGFGAMMLLGLFFAAAWHVTDRHFATGTYNLVLLANWIPATFSADAAVQAAALIAIAAGALMSVVPFPMWLPGALRYAPSSVAIVLVGVMLSLGVFLLFRLVMPMFPTVLPSMLPVLGAVAGLTGLYGGVVAWWQSDWKLVAAHIAIAHMGLVLFGFAAHTAEAMQGAWAHLFSIGVLVALMVAVGNAIARRAGHCRFVGLGGLAKKMPGLTVAGAVAFLGLAGLPGLAAFASIRGIMAGSAHVAAPLAIAGSLGLCGLVLILVLLAVRWRQTFHGNRRWELGIAWADLSVAEWLVIGPLIAAVIFLGLVPHALTSIVGPTVAPFVGP